MNVYYIIIFPYKKHLIKTISITSWRNPHDVAEFDMSHPFSFVSTDVGGALHRFMVEKSKIPFLRYTVFYITNYIFLL